MSRRRLPDWLEAPLWVVAVAGFWIGAYFVWKDDGDRCPQGRMPWSCITWVTIDRYERQFREDVPIGTSRQEVKDYLHREGIAFREAKWAPSVEPPYLWIDKSLPGLFKSTVSIVVILDPTDTVTKIDFGRSMIAP